MGRRGLAAAAFAVAMVPGGGAQASGGGSGASAEGVHLVTMDEVTIPIIDADRFAGALRFKLVLDGGSSEVAAKLSEEIPALRSAAIAAGLEFARLNASAFRAVDAEQLDNDMTAALKAIDPAITRVLIVEVEASRT